MSSGSFARRRDLFARSRGSYMQMQIDSRSSIDVFSDDEEASSTSGVSTRSLKSYRSWRRAQRNKRKKLKRAASVRESGSISGPLYSNQDEFRYTTVFTIIGDSLIVFSTFIQISGNCADSQFSSRPVKP